MSINSYYDYGHTFIRRVSDGAPVLMTLQKMKGQGKTSIRGIVNKDGKEIVVGEVVYERFRSGIPADGYYGCKNNFPASCSYERYGIGKDIEGKVPKIFVERLNNFDKRTYKEVGTQLMETVRRISLKDYKHGSKGRVQVESTKSAAPFYYKQGFRTMTPSDEISPAEVDQIIERTIQNLPTEKQFKLSVHMYLPISTLNPTLIAEPIFFPKRKMSKAS
jgi:hypothetical protein